MVNFSELGRLLLGSTEAERMRKRPEYCGWGDALLAFSENLGGISAVCRELATTGLASPEPIQRFLDTHATTISVNEYLQASDAAEAAIHRNPHAAFLLALVGLLGWSTSLGRRLYAHDARGSPNVGWTRIPYVCARACLDLGDLVGAKTLAEEAHQVLAAAWQAPWPNAEESLERYVNLLARILHKYEFAIANLADDLRDSCRPSNDVFRPEVGAILWTLGLVPESHLFRSDSQDGVMPSRRLLRRVVRQSMGLIPTDILLQYVWLQLKDRPPFNIRDHASLFPIINCRYTEPIWINALPVNPFAAYARTLTAWIRDDLNAEQAGQYLKVQEWIQETVYPDHVNLLDYLRMTSLANVIGLAMGWTKKDVTQERISEHWYALVDLSARVRLTYVLHPEWPEIYGRADMCLFHVIESEFSKPPDLIQADNVIRAMENPRSAALDYWLAVAPPRIPLKEQTEEMYRLREREVELVHDLRSSLFQILYPILPEHYRHPHVPGLRVPSMAFTSGLPPSQLVVPAAKPIDPGDGRAEYRRTAAELNTLWKDMERWAPEYAARRNSPTADLKRIVTALNAHGSGFRPLVPEAPTGTEAPITFFRKLWSRFMGA